MKKDHRKLKKKEKRQQRNLAEQRAAQKRKLLRSAAIWSGVVLMLIMAVLAMIKITSTPQPEITDLRDQNLAVNWIKGNESSRITLVEYSDFQCSACLRYYRIIKKVSEELGNDFQLIFRHFPVVMRHANALLAAKSAEAAGRQGKFWEMHDLLFEKQQEWKKKKIEAAESLFIKYAASLNLNTRQFQSDLNSQAVKDKVYNDAQSGHRSGVEGTPAFFLNGRRIVTKPRSYEAFKDVIIKAKVNLS